MSFSNKVIRGVWIISAMLRIFGRCLAGDLTRASCCNSCWCFSLNSSSAFSTHCSITWERGTYCPLLPSDGCRLSSGRCCVCGHAVEVERKHVQRQAHTHTYTLGKARCVNSGLPQSFHHHPAGFQPLKWPTWNNLMHTVKVTATRLFCCVPRGPAHQQHASVEKDSPSYINVLVNKTS